MSLPGDGVAASDVEEDVDVVLVGCVVNGSWNESDICFGV